MENEVKMGLTEEDVHNRDKGPGIAGLLKAMGDSTAEPEAIARSEDGRLIEERMSVMGMGEDSPEVREYHGRKYFIGDSVKPDGECLFRTVACEKMVHWPTVMFAELVWEHIGKFARNPESGERMRLIP